MYLSYTEYQSMGGQLSEAEFNRLNALAQAELDLQTFHRITTPDSRVKQCIYSLIGISEATSGSVSSVSNDGYSITYKNGEELESAQTDIIYKFFADTDLMYRGTDGAGSISYTPQPDEGREYLQVRQDA